MIATSTPNKRLQVQPHQTLILGYIHQWMDPRPNPRGAKYKDRQITRFSAPGKRCYGEQVGGFVHWSDACVRQPQPCTIAPSRQANAAQTVMALTDEQKRGIQAAWRVCMSQSKRVLQQRELALAELDMRGLSLQREGDFSLEMRKVRGSAATPLCRAAHPAWKQIPVLISSAFPSADLTGCQSIS